LTDLIRARSDSASGTRVAVAQPVTADRTPTSARGARQKWFDRMGSLAGTTRHSLPHRVAVVVQPGIVVLGTITAVDKAASTITLIVKTIWVAPGKPPQLQVRRQVEEKRGHTVTHLTAVGIEPGKSYALPVHRGVVWDDPRKSPIDRRLHAAIGPGRVGEGELCSPKPAREVRNPFRVPLTIVGRRRLDGLRTLR
jgi:hypothetical protein